jgi:hypothetical protein
LDEGVFALFTVLVLALGVIGLLKPFGTFSLIFCFIGGALGMLFLTSLNTDGTIELVYAFSSTFQNKTTGIWPLAYIPLLFTILDFGGGIYMAAEK